MKIKIAALLFLLVVATGYIQAQTLDYCFVVVGCNRVSKSDVTDASTANVYHLNRTFLEVSQMNPLPKYLFLSGDIILGYTNGDTVTLASEYAAWTQLYLNSPLAATSVKLVVMPGNHEVENNSSATQALVAAERTFVREMQPYIIGNNGPVATGLIPGTDSLTTDQSQLSYSFNYKNLSDKNDHFVIVDTDPVGRDWRAPYRWVNTDVTAARQAEARHIFAIGHKPAYPSGLSPTDGLVMYPYQRDMFWDALQSNRSEVMFAAHNHTWDTVHYNYAQPALSTWQVVAGNAGSSPTGGWAAPYFGYTVVNIYTSGQVIAQSMGRDINAATYTASIPTVPTTLKATVNLTWPTTITHTPIPNYQNNGPFSSSATIVDNDTVNSAYLVYSINGSVQDTITLTDSANVYKFTIPAQPDTVIGNVTYRIVANGSTVAHYPSASTYSTFAFNSVLAVIPGLPAADDIKVYPNPTIGTLTIDLSSHKGITAVTIQDINGVSLKNINNVNSSIVITDISAFAPGTYFMLFKDAVGQQFVKKIIKN